MKAAVIGNVTLDVICKTVDNVPRFDSIAFKDVYVGPGGCGSNVAIGLCALGVSTELIACIGKDSSSKIIEQAWSEFGLDTKNVRTVSDLSTGVSIGLVDSNAQPRFIHTPGANSKLTAEDIEIKRLVDRDIECLHVAGYFVLTGMLDDNLPKKLAEARENDILTSLDVVRSPRMEKPDNLYECLPHLDIFMCNLDEANIITGEKLPEIAAGKLCSYGTNCVIIKLGSEGCWMDCGKKKKLIKSSSIDAYDTTGAGDAFSAGLLAAILQGEEWKKACHFANQSGALAVKGLGATAGWN